MNESTWSTENFTSFLSQIGFNSLLPLTKEQIKMIDSPPIEVIREGTTLADAEIKLNYIIVNLHVAFKVNASLSQLFSLYQQAVSFLHYKKPLSLASFLNHLVLFDCVYKHFNADFLSIDLNALYNESITVFLLEELTELPSIDLMRDQLNEINKNGSMKQLLFLFFLSTMCHKLDIGSYTFEAFKHNVSVYNQFYISNLRLSIMIHIQMLIYVRLYATEMIKTAKMNKRGSISLSSSTIKPSTKRALSTGKDDKNGKKASNIIPSTFYLFYDNDMGSTPSIQFYSSQNFLKLHLNGNMPQLTNLFHINIVVVNINYFINKNLICNSFQLQSPGYSKNHSGVTSLSFPTIFKSFTIENLIISLESINSVQLTKSILTTYEPLIIKSHSLTFQEASSHQADQSNHKIDILSLHWSILQFILSQTIQIKKKKSLINFIFQFPSFKLSLSKSILNKEVQLFFKYSHLSEKCLLNYLSVHSNLATLINNLTLIITPLEEYSSYTVGIRISQTNFQSSQLSFLFGLITKAVINHLETKALRNIIVYEKSFANFPTTLQVYLRDPNEKKVSNRAAKLKAIVKRMEHPMFLFLNQFLAPLVEIYDMVLLSREKANMFKLIRSYSGSMIFFLLKKIKNSEKDFVNMDECDENIDIIALFANNKDIYDNGLKMFIRMREIVNLNTPFRITLIMDKYYLDTSVIKDPRFKRYARTLYENVEDFYLIAKQNESNDSSIAKGKSNAQTSNSSDEAFNYDVFIIDQCISVVNYKRYDHISDASYTAFINDFISLLSDCIEFAIYVLKNKDVFTPRFIYLFRSKSDDYFYAFNHKNDKVFIKRLEAFESLITLSLKKAKPLFCMLSSKQTSSYTEANNNFFDVFLRLFLNLHKVLNSNESLNQVFFQKMHKNIFDSYYSKFTPIAFEYKAFQVFNDFFLSNNYLAISNKQKFDSFYLIPFDLLPKESLKQIVKSTMSHNVLLYDFKIPPNYWSNNKDICYFTFHKIEKIIEGISKINKTKSLMSSYDRDMIMLHLVKKVASREIAERIIGMLCEKTDLNIKVFEELLLHFHSTKKKIIKQKADLKTIHSKGVRSEDNRNEEKVVLDMNKLEKCILI